MGEQKKLSADRRAISLRSGKPYKNREIFVGEQKTPLKPEISFAGYVSFRAIGTFHW